MVNDHIGVEQTIPLAETICSFIARNFKCLIAFGAGSLAFVIAIFFLLPRPVEPQTLVKAGWLVGFFNGQIAECERALSVYAVAYDALTRNGVAVDAEALARKRVTTLLGKAEALRAAKQRFFALPGNSERDVANADSVLYADREENVDIRLHAAYEKLPAPKDDRKRLLLAGWAIVNTLFAVCLAGWNRRKRSVRGS